MADLFVRPVAGNDANNGLTFANAKKTITSAHAAASAGDRVKCEKTPDPTSVGSCTWTTGTATITVPAGLTLNIERCETAWTASANVTATATATNVREGTNCANIAIAAAFTTGLVAYKALDASTDYSGYKQVSLWIKTTVAFASGAFQLKLCSDTVGAVAVDTITIPAVPNTGAAVWQEVTVDTGAALGTAIQSVALYQVTDIGAVTINLDNILACKDSTSADSITLHSIIGKNTATEPLWWNIRSINDTTVTLESTNQSTTNVNYVGTTESVTTYKKEPWNILPSAASPIFPAQVSGTAAAPILISGGWDPADSMATQNGYTHYTVRNGVGGMFGPNSKVFVNYERLGAHRSAALWFNSSPVASPITFTDCFLSSPGIGSGISMNSGIGQGPLAFTRCHFVGGTGQEGLFLNGSGGLIFSSGTIHGCSRGIRMDLGSGKIVVTNTRFSGNTDAIRSTSGPVVAYGCTFVGNTRSAAGLGGPDVYIINQASTTDTNTFIGTAWADQACYVEGYNGIAGDTRMFTDGGTGVSDTSTVHTTGIKSYKLSPTSANRSSVYPLRWPLAADVYCPANEQRTISCWMYRDSTSITGSLVLRGGQITGVSSDVSVSTSGGATTWLPYSITFTPTVNTMLGDVEFQAYGGTTLNCWITEIMVT